MSVHPPLTVPSLLTVIVISPPVHGTCHDDLSGECITDMIMSQNERDSQTTAGIKQSPINSFMANAFVFSSNSSLPATKWSVNIGENIAYIQSLMARSRSIVTRAITKTPNTKNISAPRNT